MSAAPSVPRATIAPVSESTPTNTAFVAFARADLARGSGTGVAYVGEALRLGDGLESGTYSDPFGNGAIAFESGTWTGDWTAAPFSFDEAIVSWSAETPQATWLRVELQARGAGRTTKWYTLAIWASGDGDVHRTSVLHQEDSDGRVAFDTFTRAAGAREIDAYRLRLTLYHRRGTIAGPSVRMVGALVSGPTMYTTPSGFTGVATDLEVPRLSQEVHAGEFPEYDGGGEAWCSPASTAMLLGYWRTGPTAADLASFPGPGHPDAQVDHAARYAYDWAYRGAGNWPYNAAYAARYGLDAFVTRLRSLAEAQRFVEAGIPLIASIRGTLPGYLFEKTNGHLLVVRGFTADGDVIANDPAARTDPEVRKVYRRADFERVWLGGSGGVVYVIRPPSRPLPALPSGVPANW